MPLSIILQSNAPWVASGYGVTTRPLAHMWRNMGHRVGIFAFYGLEGGQFEYEGFPIFSRGFQMWGSDVIDAHTQMFGADVVITNVDTHVLSGYGAKNFKWIPIVPVMEDPLAPAIKSSLAGAFAAVAISEYGQNVLSDGGVSSQLIPLPVDCGKFFPINKKEARKKLGFPENAFLIGHVGMNRGNRKGHEILLRAFARVLIDIPEAILYLHTHTRQPDGLNLEDLIRTLGLNNNQVICPDHYSAFYGKPESWMIALYSAMSIYVQPSRKEGQAMTVWEAMSAGCPIVVTEATALKEVIEKAEGEALPVLNRNWDVGFGFSYETSEEAVYQAILTAHERFGNNYVSMHNRQLAIDTVSIPQVGLKWNDFLVEVEKKMRFAPPTMTKTVFSPHVKILQATSMETNCGVGAYGRSLTAAVEGLVEFTNCDIRTFTAADMPPDTTILHVQHEPSLIDNENIFIAELAEARSRGVRVVVTFHNITDVVNAYIQASALDMALLHWPVNGMQVNDPRIHIIGGMGIPHFTPPHPSVRAEIRAKYGFKTDDVIISTFGFAAISRGHFEVPTDMVGVLKGKSNLKFQLLLPPNFLNAPTSKYVHETLGLLADSYEVKGQIVASDEFLPDTEVLMRLWMSDVGYLYLPSDTRSSSSALRFFVGAQLPTVITPSSHFADIRRGVMVTEGYAISEFAQAILSLSANPLALGALRSEHKNTCDLWRWPKFAERMIGLYKHVLQM